VATHKKTIVKAKVKKPAVKKQLAKPHDEHARTKGDDKKVTLDRRVLMQDRRTGVDRRQKSVPVAVERRACERRAKVCRRRQIDPTTCERDYSLDEIEFMNAIELYKRASGRMFPTCSEVLEVIQKLGYEKRPAPVAAPIVETTLAPEITPPLAAF
jgi:hypothetical protein